MFTVLLMHCRPFVLVFIFLDRTLGLGLRALLYAPYVRRSSTKKVRNARKLGVG